MENYDIEKSRIDNEMVYLWSAIEENLPKSQEMEALGQEKIFRAVKAGYINFRQFLLKSKQEKIKKAIEKMEKTQDEVDDNDEGERYYNEALDNLKPIISNILLK